MTAETIEAVLADAEGGDLVEALVAKLIADNPGTSDDDARAAIYGIGCSRSALLWDGSDAIPAIGTHTQSLPVYPPKLFLALTMAQPWGGVICLPLSR